MSKNSTIRCAAISQNPIHTNTYALCAAKLGILGSEYTEKLTAVMYVYV